MVQVVVVEVAQISVDGGGGSGKKHVKGKKIFWSENFQ
jgi:hypothetical protein